MMFADEVEKSVRRSCLKPLGRSAVRACNNYDAALRQLDERAIAEADVDRLLPYVAFLHKNKSPGWLCDPDRARLFVRYLSALYEARRIRLHEYTFYSSVHLEAIHNDRIDQKLYDDQIGPIEKAMDDIERSYGLAKNEYWLKKDAPKEHAALSAKYEEVLSRTYGEILEEFGLHSLARIYRHNKKEYDSLRELGRRSLHHRNEYAAALRDQIIFYEQEAERAAAGGAYAPAVSYIVASLEGLLLERCLRSKAKANRVAMSLPKRVKPNNGDPFRWRFQTLIEVCSAAGWFKPIETEIAQYLPSGLAHYLRTMRNLIHPGRLVVDSPWTFLFERDYTDALAILAVVASSLRPKVAI